MAGEGGYFCVALSKSDLVKKDGGNLSTYGIGTAFSAIATSLDSVSRVQRDLDTYHGIVL